MQTTAFLPLSPAIKSVTIIASIIILLTMGYMAYQWYTTRQVMLLVTFVIVALHPQKQNANRGEHSRQQRFQRHCRNTREKLNFFALSFA